MTDLCGPKKYELYRADQKTLVNDIDEPFLTLTEPVLPAVDYVISLGTNEPKYYTNAAV